MRKLNESQARSLARHLIATLRDLSAADGMALMSNPEHLGNVLKRLADEPSIDADSVAADQVERELHAKQVEALQELVRGWMDRVYRVAPNYTDGEHMTLTITAGSVGSHPKYDFELFTFDARSDEPLGSV